MPLGLTKLNEALTVPRDRVHRREKGGLGLLQVNPLRMEENRNLPSDSSLSLCILSFTLVHTDLFSVQVPITSIIFMVMSLNCGLFCLNYWIGLFWFLFHLFLSISVLNFSACKLLDGSRSCAHLAYPMFFQWHNTMKRRRVSVCDLFVINTF